MTTIQPKSQIISNVSSKRALFEGKNEKAQQVGDKPVSSLPNKGNGKISNRIAMYLNNVQGSSQPQAQRKPLNIKKVSFQPMPVQQEVQKKEVKHQEQPAKHKEPTSTRTLLQQVKSQQSPQPEQTQKKPEEVKVKAASVHTVSAQQSASGSKMDMIKNSAIFKAVIQLLLNTLPGTKFELASPDKDPKLLTGAYFDPKTNTVVLDKNAPLDTTLDNLIFELCNAKNAAKFEAINQAYQKGQITPSEYGQQYAAAEFDTQMRYTDIFLQLKKDGHSLANNAQQALAWVDRTDSNYVQTKDTTRLFESFMKEPHDKKADKLSTSSLPTPEMYTFEKLEKLRGPALFKRLEGELGQGKIPQKLSSWIRHEFPTDNYGYKRAKAYEEVLGQLKTELKKDPVSVAKLENLQLPEQLLEHATLRAGANVMPKVK
ncbi:hypothetical protein [Algicola sagamiensis]|uniref:hypothetical protein n=1 Tax=Algicola sagamiensis TaxID=163869 RepID=UPI000378890A|nr:hypothetical protein [Algicola sagamiensis]